MGMADQHLAVARMRMAELQPKVLQLRATRDKKQLREAKRLVNEVQREIRIMKKDITLQERMIRERYKGRGSSAPVRAQKDREMRPLADAKLALDGALNQCDLTKVEIDRDIAAVDQAAALNSAPASPSSATPAPVPPPPAPSIAAGWYPDPWGDGDHRWWDGAAWTTTVSIAGQQHIDRVPHW